MQTSKEENYGDYIYILSIDGGGVRGIIPATVLAFLESEIQRIEQNDNARIAEYFDCIAGTSTGGLLTAMLTAPKPNQETKPLMTAKETVDFYLNECAHIFPQESNLKADIEPFGLFDFIQWIIKGGQEAYEFAQSIVKLLTRSGPHPKYNGEYLHKTIKEMLGDKRLSDTLTNVIIPSFDTKLLQPAVFSTLKAKHDDADDAKLSDVCIATSAAPIYLPPHYFADKNKEFNLVDGGVAVNNPTLLAVCEVAKEVARTHSRQRMPIHNIVDSSQLVVISLGTGSSKKAAALEVKTGSWGIFKWLMGSKGNFPLLDVMNNGMDSIVDVYMSVFFQGRAKDKYIRIQAQDMPYEDSGMDNSHPDNLKKLQEIANKMLDGPFCAVNPITGLYGPVEGWGTFRKALSDLAEHLVIAKKQRGEQKKNPFKF